MLTPIVSILILYYRDKKSFFLYSVGTKISNDRPISHKEALLFRPVMERLTTVLTPGNSQPKSSK